MFFEKGEAISYINTYLHTNICNVHIMQNYKEYDEYWKWYSGRVYIYWSGFKDIEEGYINIYILIRNQGYWGRVLLTLEVTIVK